MDGISSLTNSAIPPPPLKLLSERYGLLNPSYKKIPTRKPSSTLERYSVSLRSLSECGKIWTRKTPYLDTVHAVNVGNFFAMQITKKIIQDFSDSSSLSLRVR